jgi:phosphotransferase system HPr-like phosphotransfer protein
MNSETAKIVDEIEKQNKEKVHARPAETLVKMIMKRFSDEQIEKQFAETPEDALRLFEKLGI